MLGVRLHRLEVHDADAIEWAFATIRQERVEALVTVGDVFTLHYRTHTVTLAAQHQLPAIDDLNAFAAGGLIAYGPRFEAWFRRVVGYVEQILHGAQPVDLPVEQPATFELVIHLKATEALGLTIPPWLLFEADEVIR